MTDQNLYIAPSILAADFTRLGEQIYDAEVAGADRIHVDVMDGQFVPNITMGPLVVEAARRVTTLPLDVHLMIIEPELYLKPFAEAGASSISVHVEAKTHLHQALQSIHTLGCRAGVAINPHTPASAISEVMHMLDIILVMTVNPGFGGQSFLPETLSKIKLLRQMADATGRQIDIGVDGGINEETASTTVMAGANLLIAGSAVFSDRFSVAEGIDRLRQTLQ